MGLLTAYCYNLRHETRQVIVWSIGSECNQGITFDWTLRFCRFPEWRDKEVFKNSEKFTQLFKFCRNIWNAFFNTAKEKQWMETTKSRELNEGHATLHSVWRLRLWSKELRRSGNEEDLESSFNARKNQRFREQATHMQKGTRLGQRQRSKSDWRTHQRYGWSNSSMRSRKRS